GKKLWPGGIGGIGRVDEAGIRKETTQKFVDRLVTSHRLSERLAGFRAGRERRELTFKRLREACAVGIAAVEVARDLRIVKTRIEIGEIPFRQHAEARTGTGRRRASCCRHVGP